MKHFLQESLQKTVLIAATATDDTLQLYPVLWQADFLDELFAMCMHCFHLQWVEMEAEHIDFAKVLVVFRMFFVQQQSIKVLDVTEQHILERLSTAPDRCSMHELAEALALCKFDGVFLNACSAQQICFQTLKIISSKTKTRHGNV